MATQSEVMEIIGVPVDKPRRGKRYKQTKTSDNDVCWEQSEEVMTGFDAPWPLSPFALQLTIPVSIIILVVGESKTQFHVREDILCKIPFFQAALQGSFREATEKLVKMPDDDPEIVSKLVEVLMRGDYSPPGFETKEDAITSPAEHRLQCKLFHAHVFLLGEKYACDILCERASYYLKSVPIQEKQKVFEYLVMIYEMTSSESRLRLMRPKGPHVWDMEKTRRLVASIWAAEGGSTSAHRQDGILGEVCKRCPELARDLLVLACGGDAMVKIME